MRVPCGIHEPVVLWILLQVDEQLFQLQHERADLLKRIDEDQEDLNELMEKHKALIAQVGAGAVSNPERALRKPCRLAQRGGGPWGCTGGWGPQDTEAVMKKGRLRAPAPLTCTFEFSFRRCFAFSFNTWGILQLPLWVLF